MALRRIRVFLTYWRPELSHIQRGLSEAADLILLPTVPTRADSDYHLYIHLDSAFYADLYPASVLQRHPY